MRRVFARRRGDVPSRRRDARRLGPHRLGPDRRPRRSDPDPADLQRDVRRGDARRARSAGCRCRRPAADATRHASRSGPTSSTRWPTRTTRSTSTGWRRRSPPPAAGDGDRRPAASLSARVRPGRRAGGAELEAAAWPDDDGWSFRLTERDGRQRTCSGPRLEPGRRPDRPTRRTDDADRAARRAGCSTGRARSAPTPTSRSRTAGSSTSGPGSTATRRSTSPGRTILPGFFDCHTHVCISNVDLWSDRPGAVLDPVLRGRRRTSARRSRSGSPRSATPAARTSGSGRRSSGG